MNWHGLVLQLHALLALVSGLWFGARAVWYLGLQRTIAQGFWRRAPHLVDTLLLISGLALAWQARLAPHLVPWFGAKLLLIAVYIVLGIIAIRSKKRPTGIAAATLALAIWLWILGMAVNRSILGWLA